MPKLTDTQLVTLSAAAQREDGSILPLSKSLTINKGAAASVLKGLVMKGLTEERPAAAGNEVWHEGDYSERIALAIAEARRAKAGSLSERSTTTATTRAAPWIARRSVNCWPISGSARSTPWLSTKSTP